MRFPTLCYSKSTAATISGLFRSNRFYTVVSMAAISAEDDAQYGFKRPEMFSADIANSIPPYGRHVFLCYKTPEAWNSQVEDQDLPKLLHSAINARKSDISVKTRLTVCEGGGSDGDVLIFPDLIKYKGLEDSNVESFVDDVLVSGKPWASGIQEVLTGSHVFVCAHASRDKRCGVCGPILIEQFNLEIGLRDLSDQIFVRSCSHLGQHKYAGNLVIYSPDPAGKIMGHWYGYVTPDAVSELLDQHIAKGEIIQRIWRGQLGLPVEESIEEGKELKQPNGNIIKEENGEKVEGGCCQGSNGVSCCRDVPTKPAEPKRRFEKLSSNLGSLGGNEYVVGASVVGVVASIAVAYSFLRRSG